MFLYVLHVENNFPVQDSGITLDKKIEKMTMFKAYLSIVMLANNLLETILFSICLQKIKAYYSPL
jgi:hypothetical protein